MNSTLEVMLQMIAELIELLPTLTHIMERQQKLERLLEDKEIGYADHSLC